MSMLESTLNAASGGELKGRQDLQGLLSMLGHCSLFCFRKVHVNTVVMDTGCCDMQKFNVDLHPETHNGSKCTDA